jgi:hypothetical protein
MNEEKFLTTVSNEFERFYAYTKKYCAKHGKRIALYDWKELNFIGARCSGWCDGDTIAVALKCTDFEQVYVHEFSHLTQAVSNSPYWKPLDWHSVYKGKGFQYSRWQKMLDIMYMERDCEVRTIRFAKKYDLFDIDEYIKNANMTLYFYQYAFLKGKWQSLLKINVNEIYKMMSTKLLTEKQLRIIDTDMMAVCERAFIK